MPAGRSYYANGVFWNLRCNCSLGRGELVIKCVLMADRLVADGHHDLSDIRELSDDEVEMLSTATALVGAFNGSYSLYEICDENYRDLVEFYKQAAHRKGISQESAHSTLIALNRRLLNYLSSFRTFIDHQERKLKHLQSSNQDWFRLFKDRTAFHYDRCFAYRFLWRLRNYVQHCGLPLGGFEVTSRRDQDGNESRYFYAYFDRNSLIDNFDDWKTVKDDLEKQPERIEVMPHVHQLKSCLDDLAMLAAKIDLENLGAHWDFLAGLDDEVTSRFPDAFPCIAHFNVETSPESRLLSFNPLPLNTMRRIQETGVLKDDEGDLQSKSGQTTAA